MSDGLSSDEAARRLAVFGPNIPAPRRRMGRARILASQFTSPMSALLLAAAVLSIVVGEGVDGSVILGILLVSGGLGFWQELRATNAVEALLAVVRSTTIVLRDGRAREIPMDQVVAGDIVTLAAGASVPADARILVANDLFVDQSALTGESFPVAKEPGVIAADTPLADRTNVIHMGTHVVSGVATVVVARTGAETEFGAIAHRLEMRPPATEFEHGVRRFGQLLLEVTMVLVVVIFAINIALDRPVLDALLFTLALAVGLTPQLLPAIVTVTLSRGARHMAAERVIVRRLASIEDLGGMEVLCTDKTGTITRGVVTLHGVEDWKGVRSERARLFAYLNATLQTGFPNPIDDALRGEAVADADRYAKFDEVPYDFARKRLSVAVADGRSHFLITKGALTSVLDVCVRAEDASGALVPLSEVRGLIEARFEALSRAACRCLGVAYKELAPGELIDRDDETELTFLGIVSLLDPLKPDTVESLAELSRLGIRVKVITGDNQHVAARMAEEAGLDASALLTGTGLRHMTEAALVGAAPRIGVFAEIEPNQKERIITALKRAGFTVGYLGEGINDAAALQAADVGISVDSAADVTRQAADIVLLEKHLGVLGRAVREGRRAFANTLKYVFITTSANFGNMFSMAGASLLASFLPLLPKQILLINVLTDLPAIAIATDELDPELVARPRRWDNRAIRHFMIVFGLVSSVFDYLMFGSLLLLGVPPVTFRTAWFIESVLSELLILLVIRTRRAFFRSRIGTVLLVTSLAVGGATLLIPYSPVATLLGFAPLPLPLLWLAGGVVALYVVASELSKRVLLRHQLL